MQTIFASLLLSIFLPSIHAQTPDGNVEKIQVTGSHIKRIDVEGPSPIMSIDREDLDRSGYNSVGDVLRDTAINSFGSFKPQAGSATAGGASVDLRGIGPDRTLVLLNGRRLATDAISGSVDLNLIPMTAVERIEILKDGASATYGSDALGGVVNIITRKEFEGAEINLMQTLVQQGGGNRTTIGGMWGKNTARGNVLGVLQYVKNTQAFMRDREWSEFGYSDIGSPGSYIIGGAGADKGLRQADPRCPTSLVRNDGDPQNKYTRDNTTCRYNYAEFATSIPEIEQYNALVTGEQRIGAGLTFFADAGFTRKHTSWSFAPAPGAFAVTNLQNISAPNAGDNGQAGTILYRATELGNRVNEAETNSGNFNVGVRGELGESWDWSVVSGYHRIHRFDKGVSGYARDDLVRAAFGNGSFQPFNPAGSRGSLNSTLWEIWQENVSEKFYTEAVVSGELFELPSGPASLAIGTAYYRELYNDMADEQSAAGNIFSNSASSGGGDRKVASLFGELGMPLSQKAELQFSARLDHYNDAGTAFVPKVGTRYQVSKKLMIRASAGTGYRAPTLQQMYRTESRGFPWFIDDVACQDPNLGNGQSTSTHCQPKQYEVIQPGNKNLAIERTISANLGTVFQPSKYRSFTIDSWYIKMNNVVDFDGMDVTIAQSRFGNQRLIDEGITIVRNDDGTIRDITSPLLNLSERELAGIDFKYEDSFMGGKFGFVFDHAHMLFFKQEGFPGLGRRDRLSEKNRPAWRSTITGVWRPTKRFDTSLLTRVIAPHKKDIPSRGELGTHAELDMQSNLDTRFGKFTFGIRNLLDTDPPIDDTNPDQPSTTPNIYNVRGREFYLAYKKGF